MVATIKRLLDLISTVRGGNELSALFAVTNDVLFEPLASIPEQMLALNVATT
jgi:hypothetical protein